MNFTIQNKALLYKVLLFGLLLLVLWDCKKKAEEEATYPNVSFDEISQITSFSAIAKGNVSSDGGATVTDKGFCWGTNTNPTISNNKISIGTGTGSFTCLLSGLSSGITYYIGAYATNAKGTAYSNQVSFTTVAFATVVTTIDLNSITSTTAIAGGTITSIDESPITGRGVCWNTTGNPTNTNSKTTEGTGTGTFISNLTGLLPGNTYYIKAYATNGNWTIYGKQLTFKTTGISAVPVLTTTAVSDIALTSATSGGNIKEDGGSEIVARGVCWATSQNPTTANSKTTDGTGAGIFTSNITGLQENTVYYLRAYATNRYITGYGNNVLVITLPSTYAVIYNPDLTYGTVADNDGNVYKTIKIGTQTWMAENLKTTRYRNGDPIPNVTDNSNWMALTSGAYCWYKNDADSYKSTYGAMYNWYAVADRRNVAPIGWHIPTDAEWTTLATFLGGHDVAGGKLKEIGTTHWLSPNSGATNSSGFTALPGGRYYNEDVFFPLTFYGYWWSSNSSPYDNTQALNRSLYYNNAFFGSNGYLKQFGCSVRCVQD